MSETPTHTRLPYTPARVLTVNIERLAVRQAKLAGYLDKYGAEMQIVTAELDSYRAALAALNHAQPPLDAALGEGE